MTQERNIWRRKKKFINPKVQISMAVQLIAYAITFFLLILVIMFVPPVSGWFSAQIDSNALMNNFFKALAPKWPLLILVVALFAIYANFFSHRIVGPGYRFCQILKSLINKDLIIKFKLRNLDYHKDVEIHFKDYIESLKSSIEILKRETSSAIDGLNTQNLENAKNSLKLLKEELNKYRIEDFDPKK